MEADAAADCSGLWRDHSCQSPDGVVVVQWLAPTTVSVPIMQEILDKYVVLSRPARVPRRRASWRGRRWWVWKRDGGGTALKAVTDDALPPSLVGFGTVNAGRQSSQRRFKDGCWCSRSGRVNACCWGGLQVSEGEGYIFDTPMPGCVDRNATVLFVTGGLRTLYGNDSAGRGCGCSNGVRDRRN